MVDPAEPTDHAATELRERVRAAIDEVSSALEAGDDRLASSLDSLIEAARGLTEALNRTSG
jgi:ATP-dependent exoDNAse (exonuclease V) beta subunit